MEFTTWIYRNQDFKLFLDKVANFYERDEEEGNAQRGKASFKSLRATDDIFGAESRFYVTWEPKSPMEYHHGRAVRDSIKEWSAVEVTVEKKESGWVNHHEYAMWYGRRTKFQQKRMYQIGIIHGLFYCDSTQRFFELHGETTFQFRDSYNTLIETAFNSMQCHPGQY